MSFNKIALDEAAKKYWISLYGQYGETLVKDVPHRIKAAIEANHTRIAQIAPESDFDWTVVDDSGKYYNVSVRNNDITVNGGPYSSYGESEAAYKELTGNSISGQPIQLDGPMSSQAVAKALGIGKKATIIPIGHATDGNSMFIEGIYEGTSKVAFCAKIDDSGNVIGLDMADLPSNE